jgi:hypothetical protein
MALQNMGIHVIKHKFLAIAGAMALTLVAMVGVAYAATTNITDFSTVTTGPTGTLTVNGDAAIVGSLLRLTPAQGDQSGSAFLTNELDLTNAASFSTDFSFRIHTNGGGGADGLAFVVQPHASNVGSGGGGLGYQGIYNSLAIEFDTWNNGNVDAADPNDYLTESDNHVGISLNGNIDSVVQTNLPLTSPEPVDADYLDGRDSGGEIWYAWVDYDGTAKIVEVRISDTATRPSSPIAALGNLNLQGLVGVGNDAFVGFTGATGGSNSAHDIHTWHITNSILNPVDINATIPQVVETDGDGVPDSVDNCANDENWDQLDTDGDGIGDVCDSPDECDDDGDDEGPGPGSDPGDCECDDDYDDCDEPGDGGTKADILDNSGVEGKGVVQRKAPGLDKEFNENSQATNRAGKKDKD